MSKSTPDASSSPLREAGVAMHEMFLTLQQSGFSRAEALQLIQGVLVGIVNASSEASTDQPQAE